jgi:hypothetical protein
MSASAHPSLDGKLISETVNAKIKNSDKVQRVNYLFGVDKWIYAGTEVTCKVIEWWY